MKQAYFLARDTEDARFTPPVLRAATPGMTQAQIEAAANVATVARPEGFSIDGESTPPVRLAWVHSPELGGTLCHATWPNTPGSSNGALSHVVVGVPATVDVQHVIQTWGSPLWRRKDQDGSNELPEMLYLPVADLLTDEALKQFLKKPANRDVLEFVLTAFLTTPTRQHLFLVASPEEVALCIYGMTRALPPSLLEGFTFSTYEPDPLRASVRLAGVFWGNGVDRDLPDACYGENGRAFNTLNGRRSELSTTTPFAAFAVEALTAGRMAALEELSSTWQRLGVREVGLFDLVYRMARGTGTLTKEESSIMLANPTLAAWIVTRPDALGQFLEWALEDPQYATGSFSRAAVALRQRPEALSRLVQNVQDTGLLALREGDAARAGNALEVILPILAPARANAIWTEILNDFTDPARLSWPVRSYLLPRLARLKPLEIGHKPDAALAAWLTVPEEQLTNLLGLDVPRSYHLSATLLSLEGAAAPTPVLVRTLANHPALFLSVLQHFGNQPGSVQRVEPLFRAVLAEAPNHPWVEDLVRQGRSLPPDLLDRCLGAALDAGTVPIEPLVRRSAPVLLELLAGKPTLERIATAFLEKPPTDLLTDTTFLGFAQGLRQQTNLADELQGRVSAVLTVRGYLDQPALSVDSLQLLALALRKQPPLFSPDVLPQVFEKAGDEIYARSSLPEVQSDLENVLLQLGPLHADGPEGLYRELLRQMQQRRPFWRLTELLHAFLALALGASSSMDLAAQIEHLEGDAYALALEANQRGGPPVFNALDEKTANWPRAARTHWSFLVQAVRQRGTSWKRDAIAFGAGVGVTLVLVLILKLVGVL